MVLSTTGSADTDTPSVLTVKGIGNYTDSSKKSAQFNILKTGTEIHAIDSESIRVEFKKLPANGYTYNGTKICFICYCMYLFVNFCFFTSLQYMSIM